MASALSSDPRMTARWTIESGDALEILRTMPDGSFDACLTDPPYGLGSRDPTVEDIIAYLTGVRSLDTGGDFMGEAWELPPVEVWKQLSRVLKPGAPSTVFSGTRTFDLVALGLRAARFESRDSLCWLYSSGYPHSLDVSKAIDKEAGAERPVIGTRVLTGNAAVSTKDKGGTYGVNVGTAPAKTVNVTGPATEDAARYSGYGTTLKPAWEPILLVRKPVEGTIAQNVLTHGTGGLNLDGCRIGFANEADETEPKGKNQHADHDNGARENNIFGAMERPRTNYTASGRWPPNVCLSHTDRCVPTGTTQVEATSIHGEITATRRSGVHSKAGGHQTIGNVNRVTGYGDADGKETIETWDCPADCPVRLLDEQSGITTSGAMKREVGAYDGHSVTGMQRGRSGPSNQHGGTGGASRFFYCSKASRAERELGCEGLPPAKKPMRDQLGEEGDEGADFEPIDDDDDDDDDSAEVRNNHPTIKPIALTQWLATLLLPPPRKDGSPRRILVLYSGSGSEMIGAMRAGWDEIIGVQRVSSDDERSYVEIAKARLQRWADAPGHLAVKQVLKAAKKAANDKPTRDQLGLF